MSKFPIALIGGTGGNTNNLKKIMDICFDNKVVTYIFFGELFGIGEPMESIYLIDNYVDTFLFGNCEIYCFTDSNPAFGSPLIENSWKWTKNYFKKGCYRIPSWLSSFKSNTKIDNLFFDSEHYDISKIEKNTFSSNFVCFSRANYDVKFTDKENKIYLEIPQINFTNSEGQFVILYKDYFQIYSIPLDYKYSIEWVKNHLDSDTVSLINRFESLLEKQERLTKTKVKTIYHKLNI